ASDKLRVNPRKSWYRNLDDVMVDGDYQVTFHLKRPQPAFIALLASGWSPVYPCHVPPRDMRTRPIGTGPFKFVEFKPNEVIRVARNPDYWKPGRPYLDGIEYTIIKNPSTAIMAFAAGNFDRYAVGILPIPLMKEIFIDGVLDAIDTPQWYPKVMRKDYMVGVTVGENGLDDPDQQFYENYACGSERNYTGYCNADTDKLIDRQSMEADPGKRKQIVWEIEKRLAEDGARPIIFYPVSGACWQPQFHGHTMMI